MNLRLLPYFEKLYLFEGRKNIFFRRREALYPAELLGHMRGTGFEPAQALSHKSLNLARLTAPATSLDFKTNFLYKKLYKSPLTLNFEDGHNRLETPVPIPNTEVKLPMLLAVVAEQPPNLQAVFHYFYNTSYEDINL